MRSSFESQHTPWVPKPACDLTRGLVLTSKHHGSHLIGLNKYKAYQTCVGLLCFFACYLPQVRLCAQHAGLDLMQPEYMISYKGLAGVESQHLLQKNLMQMTGPAQASYGLRDTPSTPGYCEEPTAAQDLPGHFTQICYGPGISMVPSQVSLATASSLQIVCRCSTHQHGGTRSSLQIVPILGTRGFLHLRQIYYA